MKMYALKLLAVIALGTTMMYGQATRTWVSGVGDDANPCSRTAPCKTFAGAISKTAPGGEIDALDPGGFGAITITKSITLDGGGGQVGSVLVAGTNGIVVAAGPNDVVTLRNMRINGISSGLNGVQFVSGKDLEIENCFIFGFTQNGINIALNQNTAASVHVTNSVIKNNTQVGIKASNLQTPTVLVGITGSSVVLDNIGIQATDHSRVVVNSSFIEHGSTTGIQADSTASDAVLTIDHSDVSFNANAATAGTGGVIVTADSKYAFNSGTAWNQSSGKIFSYGTNRVHDNGTSGASTSVSQQ